MNTDDFVGAFVALLTLKLLTMSSRLIQKIETLINFINDNDDDFKDAIDPKQDSFNDEDYSFPETRGYCHEKTESRAKMRFINENPGERELIIFKL